MKPSALRIERLLAKVESELARSARPRRYCFYFDEEAEAKAQGLPRAVDGRSFRPPFARHERFGERPRRSDAIRTLCLDGL